MFQSNLWFVVKSVLSSSAWVWATFLISNDTELDSPVNTDGKVVSIVLKTSRQIERMKVTILNNVCTIVARGLSQNGWVEITWLKKQWLEGASGYITALDFDIIDKDGELQVVTAPIDFNGDIEMKGEFRIPTFANTTARDVVYNSPVDWDKCFVTGVGEQNYNGGLWFTLGTSTPTPNADTTTSGKVEEGTDSEFTNGTLTGGTGAKLFATLVQLAKSILLKPTTTSTGESYFFWVNNGTVDQKITQANLREQLAGSTTTKWTYEMATDWEVTTWTDTVRVVNPKQVSDKVLWVLGWLNPLDPWSDFNITFFGSLGGTPTVSEITSIKKDIGTVTHFVLCADISKWTCSGTLRIAFPSTAVNRNIFFHTLYTNNSWAIDAGRIAQQVTDSYMEVINSNTGTKLQWSDVVNNDKIYIQWFYEKSL